MGEKARRVARRTSADYADVLLTNSGILQLPLVGLDQVEMNLGAKLAMPRSSLVQKQQRVSHVQRVGVEDFLEEFVRVGELRLELLAYLGTDPITAFPNRRSNGSAEITRQAAELTLQFADAFLHHARCRTAPAGMKGANRTELYVGHQHWNTIRGLDRQQ